MLSRSFATNMAGQVASLALGFVASVLIARWLGPDDRGLLGIALTVVAVVFSIASLGLQQAAAYFVSGARASPRAVLGNALVVAAGLAALAVPTFWAGGEHVGSVFGSERGGHAWLVAGVLVPLTFLQFTCGNVLTGQLRFGVYNLITVAARAVYLLAVAVCFVAVTPSVTAGLAATGAGVLVTLALGVLALAGEGRPRVDWSLLRRMFGYGARKMVGDVLQLANLRLDVLVLGLFRPLREVGQYVVAQAIAELVLVIAYAMRSSVFPIVSHLAGDERQLATSVSALRAHTVLAGAATVAVAGIGTGVVVWGYGTPFRDALAPMLVLLPGMPFLGAGLIATADLAGRGRPGLGSVLAALAVLVTVGLDLLLIPAYGATGAAIASLCAYVVYGCAAVFALARVAGLSARDLVKPGKDEVARYAALVRASLSWTDRLLPKRARS